MKKRSFILRISVLILFTEATAYVTTIADPPPLQTIVLKLPNGGHNDWKEMKRNVTKDEASIICIPLDKLRENCSEAIHIQYHAFKGSESAEIALDMIRDGVLNAYPDNKVTWNIIEKNKHDFLYEWSVDNLKGSPSSITEIARVFLTSSGAHRVLFVTQNSAMSAEKRKKWVQLFKESASLVPFEVASREDGLSMADKLKDSLNLGPLFQSWELKTIHSVENAYTMVRRIPPSQTREYITECIEAVSAPPFGRETIDPLYEMQKNQAKRDYAENIRFHILKKILRKLSIIFHILMVSIR